MRFDIISLYPEILNALTASQIWKRAEEAGSVSLHFWCLRDYGLGKNRQIDDKPYGGGEGMVLRADVLEKALKSVPRLGRSRVFLASPQVPPVQQSDFFGYSDGLDQMILISGRYEGVDERFIDVYVDELFSLGDFVLMSGDVPILAMIEGVSRTIPGVLGNEDSLRFDSYAREKKLKYPQYTRPEVFCRREVPEVLKSGNHSNIDKWRKDMALKNTLKRRPDLL